MTESHITHYIIIEGPGIEEVFFYFHQFFTQEDVKKNLEIELDDFIEDEKIVNIIRKFSAMEPPEKNLDFSGIDDCLEDTLQKFYLLLGATYKKGDEFFNVLGEKIEFKDEEIINTVNKEVIDDTEYIIYENLGTEYAFQTVFPGVKFNQLRKHGGVNPIIAKVFLRNNLSSFLIVYME